MGLIGFRCKDSNVLSREVLIGLVNIILNLTSGYWVFPVFLSVMLLSVGLARAPQTFSLGAGFRWCSRSSSFWFLNGGKIIFNLTSCEKH